MHGHMKVKNYYVTMFQYWRLQNIRKQILIIFTKIICSVPHERIKRSTINDAYSKECAPRVHFCGAALGKTKYLHLDRAVTKVHLLWCNLQIELFSETGHHVSVNVFRFASENRRKPNRLLKGRVPLKSIQWTKSKERRLCQ